MSHVLDYSRLLSLEEYIDVEHPVPYIYRCAHKNGTLVVFGADHSNEPTHQQFQALKKQFSHEKPTCVLLEGLQDEVLFRQLHEIIHQLSFTEAIERGGESLAAAWLAQHSGQTWQSIEPADHELLHYLASLGFSRQEIIMWTVMRLLPQYIRRQPAMSFVEYVQPFTAQTARAVWWSEAQQPVDTILTNVTELLGHDVSLHSERQASRYVSPLATVNRDGDYTVLNTIAAVATEYRDRVMLNHIARASSYCSAVLVVYGASHAVVQEPVLRSLYCRM